MYKGGLVFIPLCDRNLVVPTSEVHGRKPPGPCQRVQDFLYLRQRENVFSSFCIHLTVFYAHTQGAILLFGQHGGEGVRTTTVSNNVFFQQLVYMRFDHIVLRRRYLPVPLERNLSKGCHERGAGYIPNPLHMPKRPYEISTRETLPVPVQSPKTQTNQDS